MALVVNSNIASLNAQRNLSKSNDAMSVSLQRLSSGLRVNSAKDDAAALAISQGMTSQIRGSNQAIRNANDGVSLGQTLEGALGQIGAMTQRIREVSVQASNASVSAENRTQLQAEVNQLTQEISRVVQTTEFNGQFLLNSSSALRFQVGYDGQSTNEVRVTLNDFTSSTTTTVMSAAASAANVVGVSVLAANNGNITAAGTASSATTYTADKLNTYTAGTAGFQLGTSTNYVSFVGTVSQGAGSSSLASSALAGTANAGTYAALSGGTVLIKDSAGNLTGTITGASSVGAFVTTAGEVKLTQTTSGTTAANSNMYAYASNLSGTGTLDITTQDAAVITIEKLDADLKNLNTQRATFGAVQNRFEAVVSNLSNYSENLSQSRSRMIDADFAEETANMTKNQVLQQAGVAILAQANSLPQAAMSLLR